MKVMRVLGILVLTLVLLGSVYADEDRPRYNEYFEKAAVEFGVPADVLRGISFAETRWSQLTWAEGDTASPCNGMPRPYGIMSLWDNRYFGHSLMKAASLIGKTPEELKRDPLQNMRGAAALLRQYYDTLPKPEGTNPSDIESWRNAIAAYSGLPQVDLAQQHALDIYTHMALGYHQYGIEWNARSVDLGALRAAVTKIQAEVRTTKGPEVQKPTDTPDYPLAKWAQAAAGHWYTTGYGDYFVVIHDMEGYYLSTISYFQNSATQASAHFCINGLKNGPNENNPGDAPAGEITQMVELKYWAWHVVCWNRYMLGIEHEGFVNNPVWYTNEMYNSSGRLTAWLCNRFGIPKDRNHIIAHSEWQNSNWTKWMAANFPQIDVTCNSHTDPGQYWNWNYYMGIVQSDTAAPQIVSSYPGANAINVPAYRDITVSFTSYMDSSTTNKAFSLTPSVSGTKSWTSDFKTLKFHPTNILAFNTTYTVKVDSTAKSAASGKTLGSIYLSSFTTEKPDTLPAVVVSTFPKVDAQKVSLLTDVYVTFNKPLQFSSLTARILLTDTAGANVPSSNGKLDTLNGKGILSFTPSQLQPSKTYRVKLAAGLLDLYGNATKSDYVWEFVTTPASVTPGIIYDGFETNARGWTQPLASGSTLFADSSVTAFTFSAEKKMDGSLAGKLAYGFTKSSGGVISLETTGRPVLDSYSAFGVWVSGDESGNQIDAVFQPASQDISLDTINWRGWKFLSFPLSSVTGTSKQFAGLLLRQTPASSTAGTLYLDDVQLNPTITGVTGGRKAVPEEFTLEQNYPNPFNPTTRFRFTIAEPRYVAMKIHDVLGREIATLISQQMTPGTYAVEWNASTSASGVYYCSMTAGDFSAVRKIVLLK